MTLTSRRRRLELTWRYPVLLQGVLYTSLLHRAVLRGRATKSERQDILGAKAKTLVRTRLFSKY
jgi:hypothetical protein